MKRILTFPLAVTLVFAAVSVQAADPTPQQQRMTTCNKEAEGKKGDERKAFMKTCLSTKPKMTQQEKMKVCNKDAEGKKGDERKAFMKTCLSS